jgi:2'-5' RNA ligase
MTLLRTFTAVEITPEIRSTALRLIERLRVAPVKVTWTKADNLHYTLKFLGDVRAEQTADICRAAQEAVGPFSPFEIVAAGAGAFPSAVHPRTLWLGISEGAEPMELLFQAVERLLEPLGFPREHRRFTAHLTLGRVRGGSPAGFNEMAELLRKHADFDAGAMTVDSVTVFSSTLGREGPMYEVLSRAEMRG